MGAFDPRTVFLAKHAQHVVLVHFPIALFISGVGFDLVAQKTKSAAYRHAAYINLMIAAITSVFVLITGLIAWQWALGGARLKGVLLLHLMMAVIASVGMWSTAMIHHRAWRQGRPELPMYRLPLEAITTLLIGATAHLGGFLSGVNSMV